MVDLTVNFVPAQKSKFNDCHAVVLSYDGQTFQDVLAFVPDYQLGNRAVGELKQAFRDALDSVPLTQHAVNGKLDNAARENVKSLAFKALGIA